jgi:hypothetical protein
MKIGQHIRVIADPELPNTPEPFAGCTGVITDSWMHEIVGFDGVPFSVARHRVRLDKASVVRYKGRRLPVRDCIFGDRSLVEV